MKSEFVKELEGQMINDLPVSLYPKGLMKTGNVRKGKTMSWAEVKDLETGKILEVAE